MPPFKDIAGKKFSLLTVVSREMNGACGAIRWKCICDCGGETVSFGSGLRAGRVTNCGCKRKIAMREGRFALTHGMDGTKEHYAWLSMKQRCYNEKCEQYKNYGAKGVIVCDRWLNSFSNFFSDVGRAPSKKHSIDRIDCYGNYEPGNVRWATMKTQQQNRRNNYYIEYNGEIKSLAEWCDVFQLGYSLVWQRINKLNWTVERAFNG